MKRRSSRRRSKAREPRTRTLAIGAGAFALLIVLALAMLEAPNAWQDLVETFQSLSFGQSSGRVIAGASAFERVLVTERAGTPITGDFDADRGDELAIVDETGLRLLMPSTFAERRHVGLGFDVAAKWNAAATIARDGTQLVVVDTGTGVDDPRVRDLDGHELWRYRPDVDIPARSLEPADLDGDGVLEFYAAGAHAVARLDRAGREVWRAPFASGVIVATAPRTARFPAWVVAAAKREVGIWDETGTRLASLDLEDAQPFSIVDWPDGRFLLAGGTALRAIDAHGRVVFERAGLQGTVTEALGVAMVPGSVPAVAFVSDSRAGDPEWRLQLTTRQGERLYEETTAAPAHLLRARGTDGTDRLFVRSAGRLSALRPAQR